VAAAVLAALCSCGETNAALEPEPTLEYRILFIGNSLTYSNDLPGTVAQLATPAGVSVHVHSVAKPNFALIDHANGLSEAVEVIRSEKWDYVVLQQGPSALPVSRDTLVLATRLLDVEIRAAGGRSALLMVWPESSRFGVFDDVRDSYRLAAREVGGVFIPAGEAWREAWSADPGLTLYSGDGYHPSALGTYLAALAVYECITGRDAELLPDQASVGGRTLDVPESTVRLLQRAAHQTSARF
jgi:hypothetical protein